MSDTPVTSKVESARADLEATLDAIEEKLNVPKRFDELTDTVKASYEKNPLPWIIGGIAAAVAVAGLVAWAILSDDD